MFQFQYFFLLSRTSEEDEDIKNIVQPDIVVVCDENILDDNACRGAPDLIVKILCPATGPKDLKIKTAILYGMEKIVAS